MVAGVRFIILLVKMPILALSVVWMPLTVGFGKVSQQIPHTVTAAPPSNVMLPPLRAVVSHKILTALVVTVGVVSAVEKIISSPKTVPALLVAYART